MKGESNSKWKNEVFTDLILPNRILSYQKIVKGECNSKRKNEVFTDLILPNRILSYSKIVKGESNSKWKNIVFLNFGFAEPHPILFKDSER